MGEHTTMSKQVTHTTPPSHHRQTPASQTAAHSPTTVLESYLEALSDVIKTSDQKCETEALLDKSSTPLFIPAKTGKDVGTQIEDGEVGGPNRNSGHSYNPKHPING